MGTDLDRAWAARPGRTEAAMMAAYRRSPVARRARRRRLLRALFWCGVVALLAFTLNLIGRPYE